MCCLTNHSNHSSCGCNTGQNHGTMFLSKKRKIKMLDDYLTSLTEKQKDIEELIKELKEEK